MTSITARLDAFPTPMWIALAMLGLVVWWPLGCVVLAYILWSRAMGCCGVGFGRWNESAGNAPQDGWLRPRSSGNRAFDDYRIETLRRLEEEQHEFQQFLRRLRTAKDQAEFEQFMGERRVRQEPAQGSRP